MADELIKKVTEAMNDKRKVTVEKISEEEQRVTIMGLEVKDTNDNLISNNSYIKYKVTNEYDGEDTLTFVKFLTPLKFIVDDKINWLRAFFLIILNCPIAPTDCVMHYIRRN